MFVLWSIYLLSTLRVKTDALWKGVRHPKLGIRCRETSSNVKEGWSLSGLYYAMSGCETTVQDNRTLAMDFYSLVDAARY